MATTNVEISPDARFYADNTKLTTNLTFPIAGNTGMLCGVGTNVETRSFLVLIRVVSDGTVGVQSIYKGSKITISTTNNILSITRDSGSLSLRYFSLNGNPNEYLPVFSAS